MAMISSFFSLALSRLFFFFFWPAHHQAGTVLYKGVQAPKVIKSICIGATNIFIGSFELQVSFALACLSFACWNCSVQVANQVEREIENDAILSETTRVSAEDCSPSEAMDSLKGKSPSPSAVRKRKKRNEKQPAERDESAHSQEQPKTGTRTPDRMIRTMTVVHARKRCPSALARCSAENRQRPRSRSTGARSRATIPTHRYAHLTLRPSVHACT